MLLADAEDIRQRPRAVSMHVGAIRTHKLPCPAAPPHDVSAAGLVVVVEVGSTSTRLAGTRRGPRLREHLQAAVCDVYHARRPETHSRSGANACRRFQHAHHGHSCVHKPIRASKFGVRGAPWRGLTRTHDSSMDGEHQQNVNSCRSMHANDCGGMEAADFGRSEASGKSCSACP
ncbi:hypothetical protein V8C34DRAFT_313461 [Trichoderma compactum]